MPAFNSQGQRLPPSKVNLDTPYFGRVFEMARARYHRGKSPFSRSAVEQSAQAPSMIADAYDTTATQLYKDTLFSGWFAKFRHYMKENKKSSAFAALHCFRHMEQRAAVVRAFGPNQKTWLE